MEAARDHLRLDHMRNPLIQVRFRRGVTKGTLLRLVRQWREQREMFMPTYPAKIIDGEDGLVLVTFPDVPEVVVCGDGARDALQKAPEILDIVLSGYEAEHRPVPQPSSIPEAPQVERRRIDPALARPLST